MAEKLFYTMGEVAEMFDVNASLIRYWGTQFPMLKPKRNKKGNRLFTPDDIETLKRIYHFVKERGMTLEGAKRAMRGHRSEQKVDSNVELLGRLQSLRSMLIAVRESLGGEAVAVADDDDECAPTCAPMVAEPEAVTLPTEVVEPPTEPVAEPAEQPQPEEPKAPKAPKTQRAPKAPKAPKEEAPKMQYIEQTLFDF